MTLAVDGVVIRYGQFYGPGTFYEGDPPDPPRLHIDEAARRTLDALDVCATVLTARGVRTTCVPGTWGSAIAAPDDPSSGPLLLGCSVAEPAEPSVIAGSWTSDELPPGLLSSC